jgi:PAS domain S-box-containing protein
MEAGGQKLVGVASIWTSFCGADLNLLGRRPAGQQARNGQSAGTANACIQFQWSFSPEGACMGFLEYLRQQSEQATAEVDLENWSDRLNNRRMLQIAEFPLAGKSPAAAATRRARLLITLTGLPTRRGGRFVKAVSTVVELAAAVGIPRSLRFSVDEVEGQQCVVAEIHLDTRGNRTQQGSPDLAEESVRHSSKEANDSANPETSAPTDPRGRDTRVQRSQQSFVKELEGMRAFIDQFDIRSTEMGCVVYLAQALPGGAVPLTEADMENWAELLEAGTPSRALVQADRQMRRLSAEFAIEEMKHRPEPAADGISAGIATYELLSRVVSDTTNTVAIISRDGRLEWVNHAFEELTNYSSAEAIGMPFETFLFGTDSDPEWASRMRRMMADGKAVSGERMHRRQDGGQYWCTFNISPLHDPNGKLAGWVDIGWDTTSTRKAREELEQARQSAEAASRAKSEFLANMSHEIRTPMNAVLGMTELALGTELTERQAEYLGVVKNSAQSLLEILNDILDLSKIEAGRLELEETDFNLADLIRETMRSMELQAEEKGLELAWHMPPDVPQYLRGEPTRLRQILLNLVSNAIKFTSRGKVVVSVEKQWTGGGDVGVQLTVQDTGIGIPPDRLSRIFEAFMQADSSTTRQFGGTGLGLTITAELLRLMNGRIWVESEVGKGSTFRCTMRLREAEQPVRSQQTATAKDLARPNTKPLHILIADDYGPNRQIIAEILQKRGHTCREAENGREALKCLTKEKFDVVLMDVQMPEMDGFETTAAVRAAERETHTHQPIIAVTAYAMKDDRDKCLQAGMDAYLAKPINSQELFRLVETLAAATPDTEVVPLVDTACRSGIARHGSPDLAETPDPRSPKVVSHTANLETRDQADSRSRDTRAERENRAQPDKSILDRPRRVGAVSGDESDPIDFGPALKRLDEDADLLERQMIIFLGEAPKLVERLRESIESADATNVKLSAHRLKGLVSSYDHHAAARAAQQLERCASGNRWSEASALAASLARHVEQLSAAIRDFRR